MAGVLTMRFDIRHMVPTFILQDKNGYAIAKALEAAMDYFVSVAQTGLDILFDPEKMPEWRLDEMAWEMGCLYDYSASVENKRYWITHALELTSLYGTPQAIYKFLEGVFPIVEVEEFWQYGGEPYHFRVILSGAESYDSAKLAWAQNAIERVKNVRSVLDAVIIDNSAEIIVSADTDVFYVDQLFAAEDQLLNDNDIEPNPHPPRADMAIADVTALEE